MATFVQRTQSICDAIINDTSTQAQQLELAEALFQPQTFGQTFESLTAGEKAQIIPRAFYAYSIDKIRALRDAKRPPPTDPAVEFPSG